MQINDKNLKENQEQNKLKNSAARIRANNKYKNANYKRIAVDVRPEYDTLIRTTAARRPGTGI